MRHTGAAPRLIASVGLALAVALITTAGAFAATPSPAPPALPAITADTVTDRYTINRKYILEASQMAAKAGDSARAATLEAMADEDRRFLYFDGRTDGRAVEVFGDLAGAQRVAILVPGADTSIDTFDSNAGLSQSARALSEGIEATGGSDVAVVAWLGYASPDTMSLAALTTGRAEDGAGELRPFITELQSMNDAEVSLFCHSYGSVVCGFAASGMTVSDIVVYGSPGMGTDSAVELDTDARVWAARSGGDWIGLVPNVSLSILDTTIGFGTDPIDPSFGASALDAGDGGHGKYLVPEGPVVEEFALIAGGRGSEVADA